MPDPASLSTRDGSAWQQFFARYFALLKMLDGLQSEPSPHVETAPAEND